MKELAALISETLQAVLKAHIRYNVLVRCVDARLSFAEKLVLLACAVKRV